MFITKARFDKVKNELEQRVKLLEGIVKLDTPNHSDVIFKITNRILDRLKKENINLDDLAIGNFSCSIRFFVYEGSTGKVVFYFNNKQLTSWTGNHAHKANYHYFNDTNEFLKAYLDGKIDKIIDNYIKEKKDLLDELTLELALLGD